MGISHEYVASYGPDDVELYDLAVEVACMNTCSGQLTRSREMYVLVVDSCVWMEHLPCLISRRMLGYIRF